MTEQEEFEFRARLEGEAGPASAAAPEKKSLLGTAIESFQGVNPLRQVVGAGEAGAQMISGMAGQAVGGLRGLGELATGGGLEGATRKIRETEQAMTYQPRSQHGQAASTLMAAPMEVASEGAGWVGEKIGGEAGRAVGEVAPAMLATLAGGVGALRAAPKGPLVRPALDHTMEMGKSIKDKITGEPIAPAPAQVAQSRLNAPQIEAANAAQKYGIAIDPAVVNPTLANTAMSGFVGEGTLSEALAAANKGKWEAPLKTELGIAPDAPLTIPALKEARARAAVPSEQIKQMGTLAADEVLMAEINALRTDPLIGGKAAARKQNALIDEAVGALEQGMPSAQVLDNVSQLRKQARDIYKMDDAGRAKLAVADTNMGIANSLEGLIERTLEKGGNTELLGQFRKGRQDMAKSYVLENITDFNTGLVDPSKLAKMTGKDNAMTGAYADIGKVAGNFPEALGGKSSGAGPYSERRLARAAAPGVIGELLGIATSIPRSWAAKRIAGEKYQTKNAVAPDFRSARERLGYGEPVPEPAPMSLAPQGEALPTMRQNVEPTVRPTMELSPMAAEVSALRNKGASSAIKGDVEFTPGAQMDFPLRQEALTQPVMAEAINGFRARAADLERKTANAQGFWKQKYQAELDALKQEFGAGMEMFGVRSPQEAIGFQPLYEGGRGTRLPVERGYDPRSDALRRR